MYSRKVYVPTAQIIYYVKLIWDIMIYEYVHFMIFEYVHLELYTWGCTITMDTWLGTVLGTQY